MKTILIQSIDNRQVHTVIEGDLIAAMEVRGYEHTGFTILSGRVRSELRGQPTFEGVCGPLYGNEETPVRYEDVATFERMSA